MNYDPNTGQPIYNNQQPTQQQNSTNGFAIAGLIVSIFVSAIVGLILSIIGLNKSKTTNSGKGLAIAGIIISILKLIFIVIAFLLLGSVFSLIFDSVTHQEEYCSKAYECGTPNSSGYADCKYKTEKGWDITVSCPSKYIKKTTEPTTEPTTKNVNNTGKAKVYELDSDVEMDYYADVLYLENNKLYGHITEHFPRKIATDSTVNGEKVNLLVTNVESVFTPEYGQAGAQDVIFVDLAGKTYKLNNTAADNKGTNTSALGFNEITTAKNIKDVYSLVAGDAVEYVIINNKNQIVFGSGNYYKDYIYFDKKNNRGENLLGTDVYKLELAKTEKVNEEFIKAIFDVYVNGKKQDNQVSVETNDGAELFEIPYCEIGSEVFVGRIC
jgi:hypothetical protein